MSSLPVPQRSKWLDWSPFIAAMTAAVLVFTGSMVNTFHDAPRAIDCSSEYATYQRVIDADPEADIEVHDATLEKQCGIDAYIASLEKAHRK